MKKDALRNFIHAQQIFLAGITVCLIIRPQGITADDGISYYGTYLSTILPYGLALSGAAYFLYRSTKGAIYPFEKFFRINSLLILGVLLTPYTINQFFNWSHMVISAAIFILQLVIGLWMLKKSKINRSMYFTWMLMLLSGILSAIYLGPSKGYLIEAQLVYQICFAFLVMQYCKLSISK